MTTPFRNRHPRTFAALFILAATLAFLGLLSLQVFVPLILGPAGLLLVLAFDIALYLALRHRHRHPRTRRWPHITFGPVDKRYRAPRRDALEAEFAATFAFVAFLVLVYAVGFALRVESLSLNPDIALYLVGTVMTSLATILLAPWWGAYFPWGYWSQQTESELFDTTEDH